jgi:hypothetical protein
VCLKAQTDECRVWLIRSIVCGWRALKNVGQVNTLRLELLGSVGLLGGASGVHTCMSDERVMATSPERGSHVMSDERVMATSPERGSHVHE